MRIVSLRLPDVVPFMKCIAGLLALTLLTCLPARGEVPRHEHDGHIDMQPLSADSAHPGTDHQAHPDMSHGEPDSGHDSQARPHAGHAMEQKDDEPAEHVHPVPAETAPEAVDMDEKLGDRLPPDLMFRDEHGQPIALSSLVTKPTVIAPIYYRCPNVCHFLQGDLARVLPQLKLVPGEDFQVISVSFDETETPRLAQRSRDTYLAAMDGVFPADAWRFLTGSRDQIHALTDAIGFRFYRVGADFVHPVVLVVVSPEGQIIRYLHGTHVLPKDLTLALYEAKSGRVGTTIRKVVQYCFSFDPEQKTYVFNLLRISATVILLTLGAFLAFLIMAGKKKGKVSRHD